MFVKFAFLLVLGLAFQKAYADEPESIVGGSEASVGEFPYQISIRNNGVHYCGGSIISNQHIATAAHCVKDLPLETITVVSGILKLDDDKQGQVHRVKNYTMHPDYTDTRSEAWVHDAAVITLAEPMEFNANQKPISVATSEPPLKASLVLSGWGTSMYPGPNTNHLMKATLYYLNNTECQKLHPRMPISPTHLCALNSAGIGACSGDSGGPLVYKGEIVGIASWVTKCALGKPDVFTRAPSYSSFFLTVMKESLA